MCPGADSYSHWFQAAPTSAKRAGRLVRILQLLSESEWVTVAALTDQLKVSSATLRRDLAHLEDQGLLARTHGGARAMLGVAELPVLLRDTQSRDAKRAIAGRVTRLLPSGRRLAVGISGGTTTAEVARLLATRRDLTIVTNSLTTAMEIGTRPDLQVIMTGGVIRSHSLELVGSLAQSTFNAINVNVAILGADGVSVAGGVTTHDDVEAQTNRAMAFHAQRLMVVVDGSKIGRLTLARVVDTARVDDLVTDASAEPKELGRIEALGVRIHQVCPESSDPEPNGRRSPRCYETDES